mgnify:CR=1 FL=1
MRDRTKFDGTVPRAVPFLVSGPMALALGCAVAMAATAARADQPQAAAPSGSSGVVAAARDTLVLITASGRHEIALEVADSERKKTLGLMFRTALPDSYGMLFPYGREQELTMWMSNTYISLDMIFIRADGTVHRVEHDTEPMSEKIINSRGPVSAVPELRAGEARRLGIEPGSRIEHPAFKSR